ncbi:BPSL0067 family protein [Oleispirillum naphthae]|uniref:BPSL0067 family protein n=1 Tax=Oleispirillum naphthae TaxID=2838853 RepID=UPI003082275B
MRLSRRVGSDIAVSEADTTAIKTALYRMSLYEVPRYGMTPYPDEAMFDGVKKLQSALGVEASGSIRPGGAEEHALSAALDGTGGDAGSSGTVHVRAHTRDGDVHVSAYDRSAPGGGGHKAHEGKRRPHVLGDLKGHDKRPYLNGKGNAECVEFIRQSLHAPHTSEWREGTKIRKLAPGEPDPIARGTAIATFVDGEYPQTGNTGKHAAIYLGQNEDGIQVLDQWKSKGRVSERTIYWNSPKTTPSNDPQAFSVIEW